ncbi:hypothetical protein WMY93_006439 [Mugilogobius chulae]|uniref:Ig-like domain-containing protein n=1 Tax=Mugilogobius chulae TaxID=88201 RepID=A0AAW0PN78_9GOBI
MEGRVCLLFVICGVSAVGLRVSGSVVDVMLKPGDNTTLHCDCKCPVGVYTVWYRNCSHPNQPTLFVKNVKSKCYDLRITNITENDVGSYYCGTETTKVLDENETALTLLCILLLLIVIYTELCKQDVKEADTRVQMSQIEYFSSSFVPLPCTNPVRHFPVHLTLRATHHFLCSQTSSAEPADFNGAAATRGIWSWQVFLQPPPRRPHSKATLQHLINNNYVSSLHSTFGYSTRIDRERGIPEKCMDAFTDELLTT